MVEKDKGPKTAKEVFSLLKDGIQPVVRGDEKEAVVCFIDGMPRRVKARLGLVPGVEGEIADQATQMLLECLGVNLISGAGRIISDKPDPDCLSHWIATTQRPTKLSDNIVVETVDNRPYYDAGYYCTRTYKVRNLEPKSWFRKRKAQVEDWLGLGDQYVQA